MSDAATSPGHVVLVDDHGDFRESAGWWLESLGYAVTAFDGPSALLDALETGPLPNGADTCLILDVRMPDMSGIELFDALKSRGVDHPVIFMTGHGDVPLAVEAMRRGAVTFLEKPFREQALEEALGLAFDRSRRPADAGSGSEEAAAEQALYLDRISRLTEREREVMDLIIEGRLNKVIAHELGISPKTVELHRARIMSKMEAPSLTHLVRWAVSGRIETA